jgi:hypothetical protein
MVKSFERRIFCGLWGKFSLAFVCLFELKNSLRLCPPQLGA